MNQPIQAASALIIYGDKILFVRSDTTKEQWGFPGGKQMGCETLQQTAEREINEELSLEIKIKSELGSYIYTSRNRTFHIKCFIAESKCLDFREDPDEIIEAKWCTLEEALALNLTSTTREALDRFISLREQ